MTTPADPVIVHGNPASARLFGIGEDAVDGRRLADVCPLDAATSTLVAGEPVRARELAKLVRQKFQLNVHPRTIERAVAGKKTPR